MYLTLGIIFLIASLFMAAVIVYTSVRSARNSGELITKKNMFYLAPTFLIIYFLHITAASFNGAEIDFFYCFSLISTVLDVLKFKAQSSFIEPICEAYPIFYVDFVLAFLVGGATIILSIASFFSRRISNCIKVGNALRKKSDIIVGGSADAVNYATATKNCLLLGVDITNQKYADLIKQGVTVLKIPFEIKRLSRKLKKGGYNIIVFRDGKHPYTKIIEVFTALNNSSRIYLEANQREMKILREKFLTKADYNSNLYLTSFSKYELMARRFVVDYPVTKYIPRSFYNDNFTLKNDKQINIVFAGFGKVNYQLFRMCAMQFQFAQQIGGKLAAKPVNYYVYDNKETSLHNEFFSRILYEMDEEFADGHFPKPEKICELYPRKLDINSVDAKKIFKSLVTKDSFTYFIVSLDNDLADASYAQTVRRLFDDGDNYHIFVRAKNANGEKLNELDDYITYFGEESRLYTHESIVNDDLMELAQKINLLYNNISNPPEWLKELKGKKNITAEEQRKILNEKLADPVNKKFMLESWSDLPYIEQASNLYHALNLPHKLNLLGFDMVKKSEENNNVISEAEFYERYKNSGRETDYSDYSFFFKTEPSNVLAYIEHSRWNALYILYDYRQMKKADMHIVEKCDDKGNVQRTIPHKNTAAKEHACLTTYYGLNELITYKYKELYPDEILNETSYINNARLQELSKIYAYDYMDLDRLYSEITAMGYVLVSNHGENR
ncbi:MAG: hypothetical protein K2K80_00085 [Clostridia bacterium]|nr:hypothetical protein [Clostridia bacterium]